MIKTMRCVLLGSLLLTTVAPAAGAGKVECWTDDKGQRACGDRLPPEYAKEERQIFDRQGRVVQTKPRQKTPEEVAEQARKAQEAVELESKTKKAVAYDKFLTDTYTSVKDLERARNERLSTIDSRTLLTQQAVKNDEKSLEGLKVQVDAQLKSGKGSPAALQKQSRVVEKALRNNRVAIEQMQKDRENICTNFTRDIVRYQELRMGSSAYVGLCPAPGSLNPAGRIADLASAKAFFEKFTGLERDADPALLKLYADSAVLKTKLAAGGESTQTIAQYRQKAQDKLPDDLGSYDNLKFEDAGNGKAKVSGSRTAKDKKSAPFYVVLKPAGSDWRIVEAWSEARP